MMVTFLQKLPFYKHRWFQGLIFLVSHFIADNCPQKAASLTYTTMLSLVPMLTVLLVILSSVPALEGAREQIYQLIYSNLMPDSNMQISRYISTFTEKSVNLTTLGVGVLFFTTIMTLKTIESAFNTIWRVHERSHILKTLLRYWTLLTLGPLVLGTAFIASATIQSVSFLNQHVMGYAIDWSLWARGISLAITVTGFVGMYWFIPKANVPVKSAVIAGVVTAILFESLKSIFAHVMGNFTSYEAIYGAFAALPVFLLWLYLSWNLILLGVEISYSLSVFSNKNTKSHHPLLSLVAMLRLLYHNHQQGKAVTEKKLQSLLSRQEMANWYVYINYLKDNDLVATTANGGYVLKKDLNHYTMWQFYQSLPFALPIKNMQPLTTITQPINKQINKYTKKMHHSTQQPDQRSVHTLQHPFSIPNIESNKTSTPFDKHANHHSTDTLKYLDIANSTIQDADKLMDIPEQFIEIYWLVKASLDVPMAQWLENQAL